jgi:hypothetical protein
MIANTIATAIARFRAPKIGPMMRSQPSAA